MVKNQDRFLFIPTLEKLLDDLIFGRFLPFKQNVLIDKSGFLKIYIHTFLPFKKIKTQN